MHKGSVYSQHHQDTSADDALALIVYLLCTLAGLLAAVTFIELY